MAVLVAGIALALNIVGASLPIYDFVILVFCAICMILTVTEIVLFARSKLHSITYLTLQAVKTGVWAIVFILVLVIPSNSQSSIGDSTGGVHLALGGLIQAIVTLLAFIGTLIYASVIFHRDRKGRFSESHTRLPSTTVATTTDIERASCFSSETGSQLPSYTPYHPLVEQREVIELGDGRGDRKAGLRPASTYRELAGEEQAVVFELAAGRSVRGARTP
ncbi:MAG: hypothetical protein HETSPECPRED_005887 [Heterodermia speciosa]|uniref:Uncharacterized protein n=1 Tax=Heterodermia speciosa TaxID=116794 RepID=A0A8H3IF22_9LECA|nr:MAG: hypothetical protein HETSPECPRED_005887 [Heterodermia speciosa]